MVEFVALVLAILLTPGPTNTVLATATIAIGPLRATSLVTAELGGYIISITTLSLLLLPELGTDPTSRNILRMGCAIYLLYAAFRVWRLGVDAGTNRQAIRWRDVFFTTLTNPKAVVFSFVCFPASSSESLASFVLYLGVFCGACTLAAFTWIGLGHALSFATTSVSSRRRFSGVIAAVLASFAVGLVGSILVR
jgi:threonine/homoserine/homoserine lactone efflux protein